MGGEVDVVRGEKWVVGNIVMSKDKGFGEWGSRGGIVDVEGMVGG